tara:strand:+ start:263 stop:607 length:345 start_codon:yes stop_codon:yes gene_type:complete
MKEQLLKLQEVFAKAKGISIELGLIDEVKDRISSSDKIMELMGKTQNQYAKAIKMVKAHTEMGKTQVKIQKSLLAEVTKALSDLGVKQEPKELKDLRTTNKSLEKYISNMPKIK